MKNLGVNWFDLVAIATIITGLMVGRKRGMSAELLDLLQWLLIVIAGSLAYPFLARFMARNFDLGAAWNCVVSYLFIAGAFFVLFVMARRSLGDKLVGSDVFGGLEYYLGMIAGAVRFLCILVFLLAIVRAPRYSEQDIQARLRYQRDWAGSIYVPPFGSIQNNIFVDSLSGRLITKYLGRQLIDSSDPSVAGGSRGQNLWKQRENEVNEVIGQPRR